jgi:hypothetical protein
MRKRSKTSLIITPIHPLFLMKQTTYFQVFVIGVGMHIDKKINLKKVPS